MELTSMVLPCDSARCSISGTFVDLKHFPDIFAHCDNLLRSAQLVLVKCAATGNILPITGVMNSVHQLDAILRRHHYVHPVAFRVSVWVMHPPNFFRDVGEELGLLFVRNQLGDREHTQLSIL